MDSGDVFIVKNNNEFVKVGNIANQGISIQPCGINNVDLFNEKIIEYIRSADRIKTEVYDFIETKEIIGMVVHILRWRRCTGYLVLQKSFAGNRIICYLHDKVVHSAQCFGTSYLDVKNADIKKVLQLTFEKLESDIRKFEAILKFKDFNMNTNYGI
ncbi:hypothetical protein CPAV1605_102 [seawater metagenome]|uniref:Uncharacterized protein n=1 Tax=seawater metagenome TaxID=1561972 RepID=A0A5E8CLR1_9ZZZZ